MKKLFPGHLPVCPNMKTVWLQRLVDVGREILDVEQLAGGCRTRSCARKWPAGTSFSANWPNASFRDATTRSGASHHDDQRMGRAALVQGPVAAALAITSFSGFE